MLLQEAQYPLYADDTQAHLTFSIDQKEVLLHKLELCLQEMREWMALHWLIKTDLIIFGSKKNPSEINAQSITLRDLVIRPGV